MATDRRATRRSRRGATARARRRACAGAPHRAERRERTGSRARLSALYLTSVGAVLPILVVPVGWPTVLAVVSAGRGGGSHHGRGQSPASPRRSLSQQERGSRTGCGGRSVLRSATVRWSASAGAGLMSWPIARAARNRLRQGAPHCPCVFHRRTSCVKGRGAATPKGAQCSSGLGRSGVAGSDRGVLFLALLMGGQRRVAGDLVPAPGLIVASQLDLGPGGRSV